MTIMTGKQALIELLVKEKVEYVFGLPGATEILFMEAMEHCPDIKFILGLNENTVMGIAEGYARTAGKPAFVNLHTGCGLQASLGLFNNIKSGGVPVVITAGQTDSHILLQDPPLSGDMVGCMKPLTKWAGEVHYVADIPLAVQRALKMAMQPPTGPVFISFPQDVMDQTFDFEYKPGTTIHTKMRPDEASIQTAVEILLKAQSPAIVVEAGVARDKALPEVTRLAELIGARVYEPWQSDVDFPANHPLYMGEWRTMALASAEVIPSADTVVAIGTRLFRGGILSPRPFALRNPPRSFFAPNANFIQIDNDPWEIAKNFPVDAAIQGNIKISVAALLDALEKNLPAQARKDSEIRVQQITRENRESEAIFYRRVEASKNNNPIAVTRLMLEIKNAMKPGTLVVDDCWTSSVALRHILGFTEPLSFQRSRGGGSIGWGVPGAIGVQIAAPDRPVIAICGDGSALWSCQGLWTAAHYNLPITFIIVNNGNYRQVKVHWASIFGGKLNDRHACLELNNPAIDFSHLAQSMGLKSWKVERPEDLGETLRTALNSNKTALVEVLIENTP